MAVVLERNQDATVYCGNVDDKVQEPLLWELFLQAGPVVNVHMPKDRITQAHQGYGFVEFMSEEDADYAIKILNMIKVFGKPIRVNKASAHNKNLDVGANIFIGNIDPDIDEKLLYDTFSAFGVILTTPKIMRDPDTGGSKGFAFINFASFEASDSAIDAMNGQYLSNRPISVSYSFKKDTKGERHGSAAERLLAANNPLTQTDRPHQLFADAPPLLRQSGDRHSMMPPIIPPPMAGAHLMPPPSMMMGDPSGGHHFMPPGMPFMHAPPGMGMHPMSFPPSVPPPGFMTMPPSNIPPPPASSSTISAPNQFQPPMMSNGMRSSGPPPGMFPLHGGERPWMARAPPPPPMGFDSARPPPPPRPPMPPPRGPPPR